jgi:hypothetical protein
MKIYSPNITGSLLVTGSINTITGSLTVTEGITGSLFGTASYALNTISASYAQTSSYATQFNVATALTASGLIYPTADNGEESFMQTDGNGNLSLQYVKTIYEQVVNGESTNLIKGTPVYISGSIGAAGIVYRADAGNPLKMPVVYIVADTIAPTETGRGIVLGLITGVDTTGYPAGTEIYVAVGGGWTSTRPTGSAIIQSLGLVTKEGNGGQGLVLNPGPANLPNIQSGYIWIGNSNGIPQSIPTSSIQNVVSASYAQTSSYANNFTVAGTLTAQTIVAQTITSSTDFVTGSTRFGSLLSNTHQFTGSVGVTGSLTLNGSSVTTGTGTSGQVTFWNGTNTQTGSNNLFWDNTNGRLGVGGTPGALTPTASLQVENNVFTQVIIKGTEATRTGEVYIVNSVDKGINLNVTGPTYASGFQNSARISPIGAGMNTISIGSNRSSTTSSLSVNVNTNRVGINKEVPNQTLDISGSVLITGSLNISDSSNIRGSVTASNLLVSSSGTQQVIIQGSGSSQPVFTVQGSQGELFSITDSLSGSLFSVNDISGLPILEVFSDNTILQGSYIAPSLNTTVKTITTVGNNTIYSIPTASYNGAFFEYVAISGSNARAGQIIGLWNGASVNYTETSTTDIGTTTGLLFTGIISGSNFALTGSSTTAGWNIKTIVRSI